ncbi:glycosyltransferase family 2 protein [Mycolicibacterium sp. P1-18]|uniref:glycosyltransferase family 2 protein n=1 Tax=Mycolicibacterium sp. P1-18 TaxID=2024615 RepID=UPI0011F2CE5D|nr:glycosyltransferase family 2 protein [Mycolicibacterium sp. P1-18]KAA0101928.1 glycosyltransferase family 2 protein [Mycolicibacterium sp. P1-18]
MAADGTGTRPVVSVVLPAFDAETTIAAAVRSVLADDSVPLELIVVDDGSTDGTLAALGAFADDARVTVVSRPNRGLSASLNEAIAASSAPYVARMDADDVSVPGRLRTQLEYLEGHPDVVLVGGQIRRVVGGVAESASTFPLDHDGIVGALLRGQHAMCHPSVMMRRSALDAVGGYWDHGVAEDWDLFLRLSETGRLANVTDHVLDYAFHGGGINASSMRRVRTNIGLAVSNHHRRAKGLPQFDPSGYADQLDVSEKFKIRAESVSLGLYRRSMLTEQSHRAAKTVLLAGAALSWPPFAVRRILQTVRAT